MGGARKGKIVFKQGTSIRQKGGSNRATMPLQSPRSNGAVFKVKVKRK